MTRVVAAVMKYGCGHQCHSSYCCNWDLPSYRVGVAMRDVSVEAIIDGDDEDAEMWFANVDDDAVVSVTREDGVRGRVTAVAVVVTRHDDGGDDDDDWT